MRDVSIEYAHIYTNDKINQEHERSLRILGRLKKELKEKQQTSALVVLVDDYSFPDPDFNYESFNSYLTKEGYKPDIVFQESQLIFLCDQVLQKIKDKNLQQELTRYIKTKKYPCSLFIAAWYLLRLGYLKHDAFSEELYAKKLINILPISFKPFEDKALQIIAATDFLGAKKQIDYQYMEGRKLR